MLIRLLREIETSQGTVRLDDLSRKLGVERSALEGMIAFWARKGRLQGDQETTLPPDMCSSGICAGSCPGLRHCPFKVKTPETYSIIWQNDD
jgi:hypothetical protein